MQHAPEGKVDSGSGDLFALGNLVLPIALRGAVHDEKTAVLEHDGDFLAALLVAEIEATFRSKADRSDVGHAGL